MTQTKSSSPFKRFFNHIYHAYIPNRHDSFKQVLGKIVFLIAVIVFVLSACYIINYFKAAHDQKVSLQEAQTAWHSKEAVSAGTTDGDTGNNDENADVYEQPKKVFVKENPDFKGWITINHTKIDCPIYQTDDNSYYLTHGPSKNRTAYGALFFDKDDIISEENLDHNLVIFGHNMKNGSMFGTLSKLRSLSFYQDNPTFTLSTLYDTSEYKVFAVYLLDADGDDGQGTMFNYTRDNFTDDNDFKPWIDEIYNRSLINTGVDVVKDDYIATLATCAYDFDNARLVVMGRKVRDGESEEVDTSVANENSSPRLPKAWYDKNGMDYPY